jgi:hypothetical protein
MRDWAWLLDVLNLWYVSHNEIKGSFLGGGIWPLVMGELCHWQPDVPIVLLFITVTSDEDFQTLVSPF